MKSYLFQSICVVSQNHGLRFCFSPQKSILALSEYLGRLKEDGKFRTQEKKIVVKKESRHMSTNLGCWSAEVKLQLLKKYPTKISLRTFPNAFLPHCFTEAKCCSHKKLLDGILSFSLHKGRSAVSKETLKFSSLLLREFKYFL